MALTSRVGQFAISVVFVISVEGEVEKTKGGSRASRNALNLLLGGDCVLVCWSSRQFICLLSLSRVLKD